MKKLAVDLLKTSLSAVLWIPQTALMISALVFTAGAVVTVLFAGLLEVVREPLS
jgi:hypothetical protein